jgi:UBP zinc finger protein
MTDFRSGALGGSVAGRCRVGLLGSDDLINPDLSMANNLNDADIRIITDGLAPLRPPTLSQSVHREECTQCFDNQVRLQSRINIIGFRMPPAQAHFVYHCRTTLRG